MPQKDEPISMSIHLTKADTNSTKKQLQKENLHLSPLTISIRFPSRFLFEKGITLITTEFTEKLFFYYYLEKGFLNFSLCFVIRQWK